MFKLITAPPVEPVTLAEAKRQCRVTLSADDDWLTTMLIPAARDRAERYLRRYLVTQTRRMVLDDFPYQGLSQRPQWRIVIPIGSVQSIDAIRYRDIDDATVTIDEADYRADLINEPARIEMKSGSWPSAGINALSSVEVDFVCGYPPAGSSPEDYRANIPPAIRLAILMDISHFYDNRSTTQDGLAIAPLPHGWEDLLFPYRMIEG